MNKMEFQILLGYDAVACRLEENQFDVDLEPIVFLMYYGYCFVMCDFIDGKQEKMQQSAKHLRQLADKYQGLLDGRIECNEAELSKIRFLVQVILRELMDGWL